MILSPNAMNARVSMSNANSLKLGFFGINLRNCDAWFTSLRLPTLYQTNLQQASEVVQSAKSEARLSGHEIDVYTVGVIVCRPIRPEAEEYFRYVADEIADWSAIDNILAMRGLNRRSPDDVKRLRREYAAGNGGRPFIGTMTASNGEVEEALRD